MRRSLRGLQLWPYALFLIAALALFAFQSSFADARAVRGGTAQSVHRGGGSASVAANRGAGASVGNRTGGAPNRGGSVNRAEVQNHNADRNSNRNVNRDVNRNVNRNVDIDVDADHGWDNGWGNHPVAAGVAFGTAAAVTSAAIGSVVYSVPPSCATVIRNGISYYSCGDVWYEPRYEGSNITYVVVNAP